VKRRVRTAILISGRGSNMAALIAAARAPNFPAEIALVLSNRHDAGGLALAKRAGVATSAIDPKIYAGRDEFEASIQAMLEIHRIELVCLAGYMRILGALFVNRWRGRMINIHPSLLPAYKGIRVHERVIEAGEVLSGASVHFVVPELDAGPVIAQASVPVAPSDTPQVLADRVLAVEHKLYPEALKLLAADKVKLQNGLAVFS
jgi:phosphoribosylglycinamide formyltransferase 1